MPGFSIVHVGFGHLVGYEYSSYGTEFLQRISTQKVATQCITLTVHILQMANLASIDNWQSPGPENSTTLLAAIVFRLSCPRMCKMISLPPIPGNRLPTKLTLMHSGNLNQVSPAMTGIATSATPRPIAKQPTAPEEQVSYSLLVSMNTPSDTTTVLT